MPVPSRKLVICAALTALLALAGCGQKGELYLPEDQPATTPTDDEDNAEEDAGT